MKQMRAIISFLALLASPPTSTLAFSPRGLGVSGPLHRVVVHGPSKLTPRFSARRQLTPASCTIEAKKSPSSLELTTSSSDASSGGILSNDTTQKVASTALIVTLDVAIRRLFRKLSISFPSPLAGCGALFATLLLLNAVKAEWGDGAYDMLRPGADVLAKWLPVFFVPSLVTLPLAQSLGSRVEVAKVGAVIVGGFFFTLLTTAWSVMGVRKFQSKSEKGSSSGAVTRTEAATTAPPPKAFTDSTAHGLEALALLSGAAAFLATRADSALGNPLQSAFMLFTTLATFVFGARLPKKFTKTVHPLVTCTTLTWGGAKLMALLSGRTFLSMLESYKVGVLAPALAGAGDVLLFMLGPAVVALACQMYNRKALMRENIAEVGTAVGVSSIGGLFGTAAMVRALNIANPTLRLCLLSRNITSPLAMAIATILGADVSLAVSMVVVTGLIGANFGASILDWFGVKDAVARGLGIGAAAHGLGTAAFANEPDAFPFAAIAMALTASACTVLVSVPTVKKSLLKLALGA